MYLISLINLPANLIKNLLIVTVTRWNIVNRSSIIVWSTIRVAYGWIRIISVSRTPCRICFSNFNFMLMLFINLMFHINLQQNKIKQQKIQFITKWCSFQTVTFPTAQSRAIFSSHYLFNICNNRFLHACTIYLLTFFGHLFWHVWLKLQLEVVFSRLVGHIQVYYGY